jgi:S1-C subfamily serine protease
MLVVDQVIQNGPSFGKLHTGDVLIQFHHQIETTFLGIEEFLDEHVGQKVILQVQRGQQILTTEIEIQDLHAITPNQYLEVGGGIVHALSYQQARNAALPCGGVYLAQDGHMFVKAHLTPPCIIVAVDGKPTPDLNSFIQVLQALPNLYRTVVRYFMIRDRHRIRTAFITMDRQWFPIQLYTRNDTDGKWYPTNDTGKEEIVVSDEPIVRPPPSVAPTPLSFPGQGAKKEIGQNVLRSLVMVTFDIPYMIDGISSSSYHGLGIVIDASKGLILVDQNTVPIALGDVLVTIAASIEIPAKVVFVHPIHNFSIVQFDINQLGEATAKQLKSIEFSKRPLVVGDFTEYIGLSSNWTVVTMKTLVTKIDRLVLRDFQPPRYKASNIEVLHFDRITKSVGGVFIDPEGKLNALWLSFSYQDANGRKEVFRGVASEVFTPILQKVLTQQEQICPQVNVLPVQLLTYSLSKARAGLGLTDKWIEQIEKRYEDKRQILAVKRCAAGTSCSFQLQSGDLLLSINGQVVVRDLDVEQAITSSSSSSDEEKEKEKEENVTKLNMIILRDQKELTLQVDTTKLSSFGTDRVVIWCGLVLQRPHFAVASLGYIPEEVFDKKNSAQQNHTAGVYISRWCYGSPAHKYGLRATIWIVEINEHAIKTLDDLLYIVNTIEDGKSVRIRTIALNTKPKVFTLKTDYHYWPTVEIKRHNQYEWKYVHHKTTTTTTTTTTT